MEPWRNLPPIDREAIAQLTADLTLRDGLRIRVRPLTPEDRDRITEGFEHLSPESRFRRFFAVFDQLDAHLLDILTNLDYVNHFAWVVALARPGEPGIAVGRYVRLDDDPAAAEVALTVVDEFQRRGIGTFLLEALGLVAVEHGIRRFVGHVRAENGAMLAIARRLHSEITLDEPGVEFVDIDIPAMVAQLGGQASYGVTPPFVISGPALRHLARVEKAKG